jgi:hypothetical protein
VIKRVFVSATRNDKLDDRRRSLKAAILAKLRREGFEPQEFSESGLSENLAWSFENVDRVMGRCMGAVVIGFPRWTFSGPSSEIRLVGEYSHYEGAVALTHGLPVLLLAERNVKDRGVVWRGGGRNVTYIPDDAQANWIEDPEFVKRFVAWRREMESRKDVFLAYCSKSAGTAAQIQLRLESSGASVSNYAMDFRAGRSILSEIESAGGNCFCGVFLFSEDDPLEGGAGVAAPRDNVVFEAGYFMSSKGADRCLIIREGNAKMPADLGGAIYVHLNKGDPVDSIEGRLRSFVKNLFGATQGGN